MAWTTVEIPHREGRFELFHPRVHLGFWTGFQKLWPELSQLIQDYQNEHSGQKLRVFFTGHSLGGALATLAAFELKVLKQKKKTEINMFVFFLFSVGYDAKCFLLIVYIWMS